MLFSADTDKLQKAREENIRQTDERYQKKIAEEGGDTTEEKPFYGDPAGHDPDKRVTIDQSGPGCEDPAEMAEFLIRDHEVMIFSKSYCPHCNVVK